MGVSLTSATSACNVWAKAINLGCNISDSFEIHSKASYNKIKPTLKAFFVRPHNYKAIHVVDLTRQHWFENNCWCSTTVYSHKRSCGTMTQSNRVDSADSVQLIGLHQCCMKFCNNGIRALWWPQRYGNILQLGALEVRIRLEQLRDHGCWSTYTSVYSSINLSASHDKQIVVYIVGAIGKKIIFIITRIAHSLLQDIELRSLWKRC